MIPVPENLAVGVADAMALKSRAASGDREALRGAARQFESLMVAQMLKAMRETRFSDEDDPLTGGDSLKLYQGLLDQQWAAKMANGRGLGFADMLVKHLERQAGIPAQSDEAGKAAVDAAGASTKMIPVNSGLPASSESTAGPIPSVDAKPSSPPVNSADAMAAVPRAGDRKQRFLESLRPHAEAAEAATGVPARFILAQAALESGWGEQGIRGGEGQSSFNLFGIKAGRGWGGESVETTTTEYRQGVAMKQTQRFRSYSDYGAAFTDYASLLKNRYGGAVSAASDAQSFAQGLADGGYATDPAYAGKLKAVIASVAMAGL